MTPDEIATMSRVVAPHFGLWTPGKLCFEPMKPIDDDCPDNPEGEVTRWLWCPAHGEFRDGFQKHEIPCPDLTQPEWAWPLLEVLANRAITVMFHACQPDDEGVTMARGQVWVEMVCKRYRTSFYSGADIPRRALLEAAYQLVQREAAK